MLPNVVTQPSFMKELRGVHCDSNRVPYNDNPKNEGEDYTHISNVVEDRDIIQSMDYSLQFVNEDNVDTVNSSSHHDMASKKKKLRSQIKKLENNIVKICKVMGLDIIALCQTEKRMKCCLKSEQKSNNARTYHKFCISTM
ncbi:hypothetical protein OUZ56_012034 [Daphnia magna]|uniref:Uncharacterized protein n=1 Tax=Daphnia magna TaxID=35525 RepID=A0ABQ9Z222_9CRUS|nr:hypothetical protein OUZ56_012034 [Daphnia magna]